jgi:hypothetical protein
LSWWLIFEAQHVFFLPNRIRRFEGQDIGSSLVSTNDPAGTELWIPVFACTG